MRASWGQPSHENRVNGWLAAREKQSTAIRHPFFSHVQWVSPAPQPGTKEEHRVLQSEVTEVLPMAQCLKAPLLLPHKNVSSRIYLWVLSVHGSAGPIAYSCGRLSSCLLGLSKRNTISLTIKFHPQAFRAPKTQVPFGIEGPSPLPLTLLHPKHKSEEPTKSEPQIHTLISKICI